MLKCMILIKKVKDKEHDLNVKLNKLNKLNNNVKKLDNISKKIIIKKLMQKKN